MKTFYLLHIKLRNISSIYTIILYSNNLLEFLLTYFVRLILLENTDFFNGNSRLCYKI